MIDFKILNAAGTNDRVLKEIFTTRGLTDQQMAGMSKEALDIHGRRTKTRQFFENRIRARCQAGTSRNMRDYKRNAAADMAWDGPPIVKDMFPFLKYAQNNMGKVEVNQTFADLTDASRYTDTEGGGNPTVNLPKFVQVHANLVRHFVTRRLAGQSNKYTNLSPWYNYDSRSTDQVGKLRADAVSQRMDIMADDFGHRHHDVQCFRDAFLYSNCIDFVRSPWEQVKEWKLKPTDNAFVEEGKPEWEEGIQREGVLWVNPHPSRVFYDPSHPVSSINHDNGVTFLGHWDIVTYDQVSNNSMFWNKTSVQHSTYLWNTFNQNSDFFDTYFGTITPPELVKEEQKDPAGANDRVNEIGKYSGLKEDEPIMLMQYFEKLIPKEHNMGDYPYPIWVRFITAGDNTVVHAEFMPSRPAAFLTYNDSDSRYDNISFAHELMPYQDAMNNLLNAMVSLIEIECAKIYLVDKDALDADVLTSLRSKMEGKEWAATPTVVEVSRSKLTELGVDIDKVVTVAENRASQQTLDSIIKAMANLMQLVERMIAMSPAEMGQPAPREISATEVTMMAQSTTTVFSFISDGIDTFREAKKIVQYESLIACGEQTMVVPVINRYTADVIEQAGFKIYGDINVSEVSREIQTITGKVQNLQHTFVFTSRDGAERPQNVKAGQNLVQLLQILAGDPEIRQALGKERLYSLINEIGRMSGAKFDIKLEPGEENAFPPPPQEGQPPPPENQQPQGPESALGVNPQQMQEATAAVQSQGRRVTQ